MNSKTIDLFFLIDSADDNSDMLSMVETSGAFCIQRTLVQFDHILHWASCRKCLVILGRRGKQSCILLRDIDSVADNCHVLSMVETSGALCIKRTLVQSLYFLHWASCRKPHIILGRRGRNKINITTLSIQFFFFAISPIMHCPFLNP